MSKILGIGIDLVEIERFRKKPFINNKKFYRDIFSEEEIDYCNNHKDPYSHFAGKFASKEAVRKAIGKNFVFKKVSIKNDLDGKPYVEGILKINGEILLSISHEKSYAIAFVILQK